MSHLSLPRVHFRGEFETNVDTANNDAVADFVDVARVTIDTRGMPDDEFRRWLEEYQEATPDKIEGIRAGWNYYGGNDCRFRRVTVTRVELPDSTIADSAGDPLIGATLLLSQAVMVDLDPEGILGTQIFCDQLQVKAPDGDDVFWEGPTTRFYSRWLSFRRNLRVGGFTGASAVWQAALRGDELSFGAASSPASRALRAASENGEGLAVRFCTYLLAPGIEARDLAERFKNGQKVANPARGLVVGTIGPLHANELTSVVLGRPMHPAGRLIDDHIDFQLGPAVARVDRERRVISLDLITAFPERDRTLEKVNVGPVSLRVRHLENGREETIALGPVAYDRAAYEATAGVVDVPYHPDAEPRLEGGQLLLVHDHSDAVLLSEGESMVETDDRAVYLQEGETRRIVLRAVERGHPPGTGFRVRIEEYVTTGIKGLPDTPAVPATRIVDIPEETSVGRDGTGSVTLMGRRPGTCVIRFVPMDTPPARFEPMTDFFTNVRVLPADDYDHIPDEQLSYDFIYQQVLRYYHIIYPAMSRRINWGDQERVRENVDQILERISKRGWHSSGYMPRTRELSDGKRNLLERWCRLQQAP
jgi:hypothetical protein